MVTEKETTGGEAAQAREILEQAAAAGREYVAAANAAALSGLKSAFELQSDTIAAWTKAVRTGQAEATKLAAASATLVERAFQPK